MCIKCQKDVIKIFIEMNSNKNSFLKLRKDSEDEHKNEASASF